MWTEIRREVLVDGGSRSPIQPDHNIGSAALDKILTNREPSGYRQIVPRQKPMPGQFLGVILGILTADRDTPPEQRHRPSGSSSICATSRVCQLHLPGAGRGGGLQTPSKRGLRPAVAPAGRGSVRHFGKATVIIADE